MLYYPKGTKVVILRDHICKLYKAGDIGFIASGYYSGDIDGDCYEVRMYDNAKCYVIGIEDVALAPSDTTELEKKVDMLEKLVITLVDQVRSDMHCYSGYDNPGLVKIFFETSLYNYKKEFLQEK